MSVCCDVTDAGSAEAAVAGGIAQFGSLYGLMNNAAAPSTDATVVDLPLADWEREITVSLTDDPAVTAQGRIREVAAQANPVTRTFEVKVGLTDPPAAMR